MAGQESPKANIMNFESGVKIYFQNRYNYYKIAKIGGEPWCC
jgi:hypothetical protein